MGSSIISQIIFTLIVIVLLYLVLAAIETIYTYINRMALNRVELLPITYSTEDKVYTIIQNPNDPNAKPITLSSNERTGPEFTYSFFVMVHPSAFRQEKGLLHIFHKGNPNQWPLLGPGVYMRSDTNTLRVYMNTFKTWNVYCEVENFPVGKWVHVAVICKASHGEVFINGNLSKRIGFDGYAPYQNYGDVCCFSQRRITIPKTIPSVGEEGFDVFGVMKGMVSRLTYFNYALSYSEINAMMNQGPSKQLAGSQSGMPPQYLEDSWWTQGK
jgi:hypothetical protein